MKITILPNTLRQTTYMNSSTSKTQSRYHNTSNIAMKGFPFYSDMVHAMGSSIICPPRDTSSPSTGYKDCRSYYADLDALAERSKKWMREEARQEKKERIEKIAFASPKDFENNLLREMSHSEVKELFNEYEDFWGTPFMHTLGAEECKAVDEYCDKTHAHSFFIEKLCVDSDNKGNIALHKFDRTTLKFWNSLFTDKSTEWNQKCRYVYAFALAEKNSDGRLVTQKEPISYIKEDNPKLYAKIYTKQDEDGYLPAHSLSAYGLRDMVYKLKNKPKLLEQIFTTQNCCGQLPAHYYDEEQLGVMINSLKDKPEVLKKIFTTQDKLLNLPAHYYRSYYQQKAMVQALKNQPNVISKIYTTQNYRWSLPYANSDVLRYLAECGEKDAFRKIMTNIDVSMYSRGMDMESEDLRYYFDLFKVGKEERDDLSSTFSTLAREIVRANHRQVFKIANEKGF